MIVLDDNIPRSNKFAPRGFVGAVVGYGPAGSYRVVDVDEVGAQGRMSIYTTRDVRLLAGQFPMKDRGFDSMFMCRFLALEWRAVLRRLTPHLSTPAWPLSRRAPALERENKAANAGALSA